MRLKDKYKNLEIANKRLEESWLKSKNLLKESSSDYSIIQDYIKWSKYDILNSWGSCAFYTQDFLDFCKATGKQCSVIYMPLANPKGDDPEDHIVPVFNNQIIDFAKVPGAGVSKYDRTGNPPTLNPGSGTDSWPLINMVSDNLFTDSGVYGKLGYLSNSKYADWEYNEFPELKKSYPIKLSNLPSFATQQKPKTRTGMQESIDKTAGVWDTNEKFKDGSDFKIKFKVSDIIELAKNKTVEELNPKSINYDFSGRKEDESETNKRVMNADLSYPILVVQNEKGKIFGMLDGTHRLQKALKMGLDKIKVKIFNKEELLPFKVEEFKY